MKISPRQRQLLAGGLVGGMLLLALLFAPEPEDPVAAPRLTTHSRDPSGARGLYETAERFGWRVLRHERPALPVATPGTVYASLAPAVELTPQEVHELLESVRAGAALFAVLRGSSPLADSLGVTFTRRFASVPRDPTATCDLTPRERAVEALRGATYATSFELKDAPARNVQTFLVLDGDSDFRRPAMASAGFALERGRVGVVSDPGLLTNAVFRACRLRAGVSAVQLLDFVSSDDSGDRVRRTLVFDEYRHGYGEQPSITRVTRRFLTGHPAGRMLSQVSLAGLVLLTAAGSRPSPPGAPATRVRRSPLEHARALSHAYSQVSATRTATRLLVRGLRRRLRLTRAETSRPVSDDEFLSYIAGRFPALAADTARIGAALRAPVSASGLVAVGRSISNIERTISANQ